MIKRRHTSQFMLGNVGVGSEHPVSVQSMTTTKTRDTEKTLEQNMEWVDSIDSSNDKEI